MKLLLRIGDGKDEKLNGTDGRSECNDEWNTAIELPQQSYSRKNSEKPLLTA